MTPEEYLAGQRAASQEQTAKKAAFLVSQPLPKSPDETATAFTLAKSLGLPPAVVDVNYKSFAQKMTEKRNETILKASPKLSSWLTTGENYRIAADTVDELSWWERFGKEVKETGKSIPGGAVSIAGQATEGVGQLINPVDPAVTFEIRNRIASAQSKSPAEIAALRKDLFNQGQINPAFAQSVLSDVLDGSMTPADALDVLAPLAGMQEASDALQAGGEAIQQYGSEILPADKGMEDSVGRQLGSGLGSMATIILVSLLTGGMGAATFGGAAGAGEASSRAREAGQDEEMQSLAAAFGILPGMTDAIPVERLLANPALKAGLSRFFLSIGKQSTTEGFQEAFQQLLQNSIAQSLYAPDQGLTDGLIQSFATGGFVGALVEAGRLAFNAVLPGRLHRGSQQAAAAPDQAQTFADMSAAAQQSVLRNRSPDAFRQFLEQATNGTPNDSIYVDANAFKTFAQSRGQDPFDLIDELDGVTRDDWAAAQESGDLKIPTATYAAKLAGSEYDQFIMENGRFSPDAMSMSEAARFEEMKADLTAEAWQEAEAVRNEAEEFRSMEEQIYDSVVSRLRVAGQSVEASTAPALLWQKFYSTMAAKSGMSIGEFMGRYALPEVRGSVPAGLQLRNVDELNRTLAEARTRKAVKDTRTPLLEWIADYGGINDVGGELKAMGATEIKRGPGKKTLKLARKGMVTGMKDMLGGGSDGKKFGADDVARAAIEAGYLQNDPIANEYRTAMMEGREVPDITAALWDAIDRELRGEPDFAEAADAVDANAQFDEMEAYLSTLGVSLDDSDDAIRQALEKAKVYGQGGAAARLTEEFFKDQKISRWVLSGKPKFPRKLYRGESSDSGSGMATYGQGLYMTGDKRAAQQYGEVREVSPTELPDNPLYVKDRHQFENWIGAIADKLGVRRSDMGVERHDVVISAGYDGVIVGNGDIIVAYPTEFLSNRILFQNEANQSGDTTQTPEFKAWFGDSKVVDADGKPLVVYHGTGADFEAFDNRRTGTNDRGLWGRGHYLSTSSETASMYAMREGDGARVIAAYASIKNPLIVTTGKDLITRLPDGRNTRDLTGPNLDGAKIKDIALAAGNDGVIQIKPDGTIGDIVAFSPEQIKSVNNRGTFNSNDPRILYQSAYHGTPHLFEKFSTDRIGTGEGNQAFGWGLYFAGDKSLAQYYRDMLKHSAFSIYDEAKKRGLSLDKETRGDVFKFANQGIPASAGARLIQIRNSAARSIPAKDLTALINDYREATKGRLFEVELPENENLLSWEQPLNEQSEQIQAAMQSLGINDMNVLGSAAYAEIASRLGKDVTPQGPEGWVVAGDADATVARQPDPKAASLALAAAGIPGHRYLDGASRASDGSYNYVIYDDSQVAVRSYEQNEGGPRGLISFPAGGVASGDTVIRLMETANLSTFLHESGHFFLAVMQDMAARGGGPISAEYDVVKSWWRENAAAVAADARKAMPDVNVTSDDVIRAIDTGSTGDMMMDGAIDVGMQEQWARGFEAYLMEGKAPSVELQSVFEKFMYWLQRIYKSALGLGVKINDDIRGVFDRMLATEAEITRAKEMTGDGGMIFATAEQMGMTPEQFDKFTKLVQQGTDQAKAKVRAEAMEPIRRETEKQFKEQKAAMRADVERELKSTPIYRAIQEMRFGKTFEGDDTPIKLDRALIERDYGAGYVPFLPGASKDGKGHRNAVFANEGGVHPDIAAGMYGFETGRDLLDKMSNVPPLSDAIKAETDKRVFERYGDPLQDGSIEEIAMEAVHNDKKAQALEIELKALTDIAGDDGNMLTRKEAREAARQALKGMAVADAMRFDRFLAAERKAGEEAATQGRKVVRSGMWMQAARRKAQVAARASVREDDAANALRVPAQVDAANESTGRYNEQVADLIDAKRRQLLNHMMYAESRKVRETVEGIVDKVGKLNKPDARLGKTIGIDYVKAARTIAAKFGLARPVNDFEFRAWMEQLAQDDPVTADAMRDTIQTYTQDAKDYKQLKVGELEAVATAIDNILTTGKRVRVLEIGGQKYDRDAAKAELIAVIDARGTKENAALSKKLTALQYMKIKSLDLLSSLRRMEAWTRDMDDGKQGVFTKYLVRPVMDALGEYRTDRTVRLQELLDVINARKDGLLGAAINAPELRYTFENKGELIHALLHTGNESNLEKLLLGRGWSVGLTDQTQAVTAKGKPRVDRQGNPIMTRGRVDTSQWDAFLARMISEGTITKEDYDLARAIWDLMESTKRPAQATHKKIYGHYFDEVEASIIQTPWGPVKGGYVPAIADRDASNDGQIRADQAAMEAQQSSFMFPTTGSGFTKSRVQNYNTPLALDLMLLPAHLDKVLRFTHLEPVVRQTASLISDRELRAKMDDFDKSIIPNLIMPWLQRTSQQAVEAQATTPAGRAASAIFRSLRRRVGVHTMFMNVVNSAQQVAGLSTAMGLVKPSLIKLAMIRFIKGDGARMRQEAVEASPYMKDRVQNASREIQGRIQDAITKPTVMGTFKQFAERHGYFLQTAVQSMVDIPVWHAAYTQATGKGMTHADAVFEADSVIRLSQSDMNPESVSLFETGTAFTRLFTMFYSYFNGQANLIGTQMSIIMRTQGWAGSPRMFYIYLMGVAVPAIIGEAIVQAARGELGDEDDDGYADDLLSLMLGSQARYIAGALPGVGQIGTAAFNRFNDQQYDDRISTSPVLSVTERAIGAPATISDAVFNGGDVSRATGDGLTLLGLILGVPTGWLVKTSGYAIDVAEGDANPAGPVDLLQGAVSGRDGTQ